MVKNTKIHEKSEIEISNVMEKFGKYQVIQFVLLCLPAVFINMINVNYIFAAGDINYRCRIPECEGMNNTFEVGWWPNASIDRCIKPLLKEEHTPGSRCTNESFSSVLMECTEWVYESNNTVIAEVGWWPNASIDRCIKPLLKEEHTPGSRCTNESFSSVLMECTEWVYESNNTVIAELNLGCQPWLSNLIGTIHNFGMMASVLVYGWMPDRFGRKPTLIFCVVCGCIGQLKTLATSYYMYVAIEFCEAAVTGGSYAAAMVLILEMCGNRIMSGVVFSYAIYTGECLYAVIAMFVPYWKTLIHIINSPSILFIFYVFLIRESPRWQILNGRTEKAKETMLIVAQMNKVNINRQELSELDEVKLKNKFNIGAEEKREGLREIFTSKEIMKRVLVAFVCRFTASFVYYGMMINSVFLPGNKYTNFLLQTVMSFPGELISLYLMNKIGRKMPLLIAFLVCGGLCVGTGYVPEMYTWTKIFLFLIGKMLISVCFTGVITYIMELFPTSARGSLLGFGAFAARVGGMLAPFTPILNPISPALPSIIFGCSALLSGVLLTLTPETKDLPLMDTIRQVEESVCAGKDVMANNKSKNPELHDVVNDI